MQVPPSRYFDSKEVGDGQTTLLISFDVRA